MLTRVVLGWPESDAELKGNIRGLKKRFRAARDEGGARARSLRGTLLHRLASPRLRRPLLLRVRRRRTRAAFSPLARMRRPRRRARARGLNGTSPTRSPPPALPSRASSRSGFRAARSAIATALARRKGLPRRGDHPRSEAGRPERGSRSSARGAIMCPPFFTAETFSEKLVMISKPRREARASKSGSASRRLVVVETRT